MRNELRHISLSVSSRAVKMIQPFHAKFSPQQPCRHVPQHATRHSPIFADIDSTMNSNYQILASNGTWKKLCFDLRSIPRQYLKHETRFVLCVHFPEFSWFNFAWITIGFILRIVELVIGTFLMMFIKRYFRQHFPDDPVRAQDHVVEPGCVFHLKILYIFENNIQKLKTHSPFIQICFSDVNLQVLSPSMRRRGGRGRGISPCWKLDVLELDL